MSVRFHLDRSVCFPFGHWGCVEAQTSCDPSAYISNMLFLSAVLHFHLIVCSLQQMNLLTQPKYDRRFSPQYQCIKKYCMKEE